VTEAVTGAGGRGALFVEGGGLRGAFSAGALAELARPGGPRFDDVMAVSSGAPTAAYLIADQIDAGLSVWERNTHGAQLVSPKNLLRRAPLLDIDRLVDLFARGVPLDRAALSRSSTRLWVVVTNAETGRAETVRATPGNVLSLLRATMALPIAYGKIVEVDGARYVDGGVVNSVPVDELMRLSAGPPVAILTRPRGYRRRPSALVSYLVGRTYPRHPAIGRALAARARVSNGALDVVDTLEDRGELVVIRPTGALPAGRLSTKREAILDTIAMGRAAAKAWLARR
jgi:predicted patatin/cPLA2 family phospholipase